jgi:hypothetical protein
MPLQKISIRPGIDRNNTNYSNEGGFYACDKVRFRAGTPEKLGGWVKYITATFLGTARGLFNWVTLDRKNLLAIGTNIKYYLEHSDGLYDITPIRATATLSANAFAATINTTTVKVTHAAHGGQTGDYVTFSGAAAFAGIPASSLNTEFKITVADASTYIIEVKNAATSTTTGGGAAIVAAYQITTAPDISVPGRGWNAGAWGRGAWNSAADTVVHTTLRQWSQESFGEDHVFCLRGALDHGDLYFWQNENGLTNRAVKLSSLPGAIDTPLMATCMLLSVGDRHLLAFGTNAIGSTAYDPLLVRWADTESVTNWTPAITNAAGDLRLSSGNRIVIAVRYRQEIIVFTDTTVFGIQFIGAPDIFGQRPLVDNISVIAPRAVVATNHGVYWMGNDKFYFYNGSADTLPCTLRTYVFNDINMSQAAQIFGGTNEGFSEVWWFYCSARSTTVDRYVIYNYDERLWAYGSMSRTAWLDSPLKTSPIAAGDNHTLYLHENGVDDDRTTPLASFIESSDFDITDGEDFLFVKRLLPDVMFDGSSADAPSVTFTLTPRNAPGGAYKTEQANSVTRSAVVPVEQFTERCDVRLRGRQIRLRLESNELGVHWKWGVPRIEVQPDGRKA